MPYLERKYTLRAEDILLCQFLRNPFGGKGILNLDTATLT